MPTKSINGWIECRSVKNRGPVLLAQIVNWLKEMIRGECRNLLRHLISNGILVEKWGRTFIMAPNCTTTPWPNNRYHCNKSNSPNLDCSWICHWISSYDELSWNRKTASSTPFWRLSIHACFTSISNLLTSIIECKIEYIIKNIFFYFNTFLMNRLDSVTKMRVVG